VGVKFDGAVSMGVAVGSLYPSPRREFFENNNIEKYGSIKI
jgi:hypothetical protein